jgi:hypothetical protein
MVPAYSYIKSRLSPGRRSFSTQTNTQNFPMASTCQTRTPPDDMGIIYRALNLSNIMVKKSSIGGKQYLDYL